MVSEVFSLGEISYGVRRSSLTHSQLCIIKCWNNIINMGNWFELQDLQNLLN